MPYNVFDRRETPIGSIARDIVPVTPDDNNDLAEVAAGLRVTTGGTITVTTEKGVVRGPITVDDREVLPLAVKRVHASGTTATGIWAFIA
jgi:uncharacterized protein (UPF0254 family)